MTISMYQASVPPMLQMLNSLTALLDKAAAFCETRKIDPAVLLNTRLFPNMFPLLRQVQVVTDQTKGSLSRLAGVDIPRYADTEASFDELRDRLARTIAFVRTFTADSIDGTEAKTIELKIGGNPISFTGQQYLVNFVLPNIYFHCTTAFAILRHCGMEIGKSDYLGSLPPER